MSTIYAGPGKVYFNSLGLQPEGENGAIRIVTIEDTAPIASAMFGVIGPQLIDQRAEIAFTPLDSWSYLATFFPTSIGVTVGASTGALVIGTRPHGAVNTPVKVWTPDGRIYHLVRAAVTGHPTMTFGPGKPLFGEVTLTCLGDMAVALGASGFLFDSNAITESAGADPGGNFTDDLVRGHWTGAWGTVAGFGGDGGDAMQAEDGWTLQTDVRYSLLKVDGLSRAMKLDSVAYMIRGRLYGPTHTQIVGQVGAHTLGLRIGSSDLVLTGPSSKTVTLKNAGIVGAGFEFGGTTLGTGEIGFVSLMTWTTGAPDPLLIFSA